MEIITKKRRQDRALYAFAGIRANKDGARGKKVGVAYQLENGEVIYVPE